jgi:hypothetical protein
VVLDGSLIFLKDHLKRGDALGSRFTGFVADPTMPFITRGLWREGHFSFPLSGYPGQAAPPTDLPFHLSPVLDAVRSLRHGQFGTLSLPS